MILIMTMIMITILMEHECKKETVEARDQSECGGGEEKIIGSEEDQSTLHMYMKRA
jgi:hypothetical protein